MAESDIDIGDEVICIDAKIQPDKLMAVVKLLPNWIIEKKKYIVRDVLYNDDIAPALLLAVVCLIIWLRKDE